MEIDTLWNVKAFSASDTGSQISCRNRYIVECKGASRERKSAACSGRNRYIVECKEEWERIKGQFDARRNRYIVECKELPNLTFHVTKRVEIDTLWNVKKSVCVMPFIFMSRNRYIVECKGINDLGE